MPVRQLSLRQLFAARRSVRRFAGRPITRADLVQLLWAAGGEEDGHRLIPSAGGLHTIGTRVAVGDVEGLEPGVYGYQPAPAGLRRVKPVDVRDEIRGAAIESQPWLAEAAAIITWAADFDTAIAHYGDQPPAGRGERYLWLETGCAVQNTYLQATALGLGGVFVGAFDDHRVAEIMGLADGERALGLFAVGVPAQGSVGLRYP